VSAARPERAGAAGAITETGAELGGALGIALLGSLGLWVYRHLIGDVPVAEARRTLGDAEAVAGRLPAPQGQDLLEHARHAFQTAFAVISGTATLIITVLAVIVMVTLRERTRDSEPAGACGKPR
jgi:DHA2 family multidrug resistance protein-like MFS transporter